VVVLGAAGQQLDGGSHSCRVPTLTAAVVPVDHTHAHRCLHTATIVLKDLPINATNVEEFVRETLGEDTCDARRSVSDPSTPAAAAVHTARGGSNRPPRPGPAGPCSFDKGLSSTYPSFAYRVYEPEADADRSFGLLGDSDHLWMFDKREQQKEQVRPAGLSW
jgi:hypothetical protein